MSTGKIRFSCRDDSATIVALMSRLESITARIVAAPIISSTIVRAGRSAVAISASATAIGTGFCAAAREVTSRRESLCHSSDGVHTPAMHRILLRDTFLSQAA
jgi:hypothetical protein